MILINIYYLKKGYMIKIVILCILFKREEATVRIRMWKSNFSIQILMYWYIKLMFGRELYTVLIMQDCLQGSNLFTKKEIHGSKNSLDLFIYFFKKWEECEINFSFRLSMIWIGLHLFTPSISHFIILYFVFSFPWSGPFTT